MRTQITKIALCLFVLFSTIACKKDNTPEPTCRVTNMVIEGDTLTFNYNAANKVSQIASFIFDLGIRNHNFSYNGNSLTYTYTLRDPETYTLNNDGMLKSMIRNYTISGSPQMDVMNFEYNSNKQLKAVYHSISSVGVQIMAKDTLIYENGNLIQRLTYLKLASSTSYPTTPNEEVNYTYGTQLNTYGLYTTKNLFFTVDQNIVPHYDGMFPFFTHLLGNGSSNLCTNVLYTDNGRGITENVNFYYTNPNDNTMNIVNEIAGIVNSEMSILKSCN